jgi:hypothetical protein
MTHTNQAIINKYYKRLILSVGKSYPELHEKVKKGTETNARPTNRSPNHRYRNQERRFYR